MTRIPQKCRSAIAHYTNLNRLPSLLVQSDLKRIHVGAHSRPNHLRVGSGDETSVIFVSSPDPTPKEERVWGPVCTFLVLHSQQHSIIILYHVTSGACILYYAQGSPASSSAITLIIKVAQSGIKSWNLISLPEN